MFTHVTEVKHLDNYRLHLTFNTGDGGEVDLIDRLKGEVFSPLRDVELFATATLDPIGKTVTWANGADLAPEYLLQLLKTQSQKAA
jgi:hypothetical protein